MNKDTIVKGILSLLIVSLIFGVAVFIVNFDGSKDKKEVDLSLDLDSDIVSTDPTESAANFLSKNGTIGDLEGLEEEDIVNINFEHNGIIREQAFEEVKDAVIPDSPLIDGKEEDVFSETSQFPIFYSIENLEVSKPTDEYKMTIEHNGIGTVEYDTVNVSADFKSLETTFYWPTDSGSDGIITKEVASDKFQDIEVTLVRSGDLWFIYDVEDSEYTLNARMSTWSGRGNYDVSPDQEVVEEYIIEDIFR